MTTPIYLSKGSPLVLGKRIGRGGEGEVYLIEGQPRTAAKIYTGVHNPEREAKVMAMVRHNLAGSSDLVAFPKEVIQSKSGKFAGFTMAVVDGHRPLHEVYGPKSRKTYFPKADFRFLLRAATNIARAVGQVHQSPCVIGDINHSGILVSQNATVAIIDADSFQFEADGRVFPCLVGVPDFTPPELQGASLKGVVRTKYHDRFGLGIAIFQMLFMGRHPYAGRHAGADLSLEQLIAKNLFAYSRIRKTNMSPPNFVATLDDYPPEVADAFERAFGPHPDQRPTAAEWVEVLHSLEGRLSRCGVNPMHYYPSHSKNCPWCRMENSSGAMLFISPIFANVMQGRNLPNFDVEQVWASISSITLPSLQYVPKPKLKPSKVSPSSAAKAVKAGGIGRKVWGTTIIIGGIVAWFAAPAAFFIWLGVIWYGLTRFGNNSDADQQWKAKYTEADRRFQEALADWQGRLGITRLHDIRSALEAAAIEYRGLAGKKTQALGNLKAERHKRQLHDYLDRFFLKDASISGLGKGKIASLASYGIESAADVNKQAIMRISGFGEATASKLVAWRLGYEKRFVYNPAPNPADAQAQAKIENDFAARANTLITRLSAGAAELSQALAPVQARINTEDTNLSNLALELEKIECDLNFLGISKPARIVVPTFATPSRPAQTFRPQASAPATPSNNNSTQCPVCNSAMIRRTARRGRNKGNQFWGCSRYPICTGTRP